MSTWLGGNQSPKIPEAPKTPEATRPVTATAAPVSTQATPKAEAKPKAKRIVKINLKGVTDEKLDADIAALEQYVAAKKKRIEQKAAKLALAANAEAKAAANAARIRDNHIKCLIAGHLLAQVRDSKDAAMTSVFERIKAQLLDNPEVSAKDKESLKMYPLPKQK